jgi:hypothetical protein
MSREFVTLTDEVVVAPSASINDLVAYTYAAWIFPTNNTIAFNFQVISVKDSAGVYIAMAMSNGYPIPSVMALTGYVTNFTGTEPLTVSVDNVLTLNTWQRVAMTYDNNGDRKVHLYVNGSEVVYAVQPASTGTQNSDAGGGLMIGNDTFNEVLFDGSIAEFELWNVALSSAQIAADFTGVPVLSSNLVDSLTFLTDQGSPEPDISGNGNVGVIIGAIFNPNNPPAPMPNRADIFIPIPFGKRTTAAVALFACFRIASPAGARKFTSDALTIAALQLEYAQMLHIYHRLRHQDTANNRADLFAAIDAGVILLRSLNATIQGMMASAGDNEIALKGMQVVVYNALTTFLRVQEDEFGVPF